MPEQEPARPVPDERFAGSLGASAPASPFGGPPSSPFGGPPSSPFGAPPPPSPFGAPPGVAPAGVDPNNPYAGGWAGAPAPAPPPRRGVKVAVVAVASLVVLLVAAAVIAPLYLAQRDRHIWATRHYQMPVLLDGAPPLSGAMSAAVVGQLTQATGSAQFATWFEAPVSGVYGRSAGTPDYAIAAVRAKHVLRPSQRRDLLRGFKQGVRQASGLPMHDVSPGKLGGSMECAEIAGASRAAQVCMVADPAGMMVIIVAGSGAPGEAEVRAAREAVELTG